MTNVYRTYTVELSGNSVHLVCPDISMDITLVVSQALTEVRYVGIGCDNIYKTWVKDLPSEWDTTAWRKGKRGYSNGAGLV